jgi:hypothetical protein
MAAVEMTDNNRAAIEVDDRSADHADEVPVTRNPEATVVVAGYPDVSGTRARRYIGHRPANCDSNPSGLSLSGTEAQSADDQSCC